MNCWIAIDWGTSTLRCWLIGDEADKSQKKPSTKKNHSSIIDYHSRPWGVKFVKNFGKSLTDMAGDWWKKSEKDVFACGMIGSSIGWKETPYIQTDPYQGGMRANHKKNENLLTSFPYRGKTIHLQSGWSYGVDDVMRGEETAILGLQNNKKFSKLSGLLIMPGTHSKWVQLKFGKVHRFVTAITGELFEVIGNHSILSQSMHNEKNFEWKSFVQGLEEVKTSRLMANLFKLRANYLHGIKSHYRDRLSGQLLGEEMITMGKLFDLKPNTSLYVIGDKPNGFNLTNRYIRGLRHWGYCPEWLDSTKLTLEGLIRIRNIYKESKSE